MKKSYMMTICILAMMTAPSVVFAADVTDAITTATPTITNRGASNTAVAGPASITFDPSPNVTLSLYSTILGYAVTSTNTLTSTTNGMEYAAHHEATGYAQRPKVATTIEAPTGIGLGGLTDTDWVWMGGGGS